MHTAQEIQAIYSKASEHTIEAAQQAVYNLGLQDGREDTLAKLVAKDPPTVDALERAQKQAAEDQKAADLKAKEDDHNAKESRKRQAHDAAQEEHPTPPAGKAAAADKAKSSHR
jgi:hypothetical protein